MCIVQKFSQTSIFKIRPLRRIRTSRFLKVVVTELNVMSVKLRFSFFILSACIYSVQDISQTSVSKFPEVSQKTSRLPCLAWREKARKPASLKAATEHLTAARDLLIALSTLWSLLDALWPLWDNLWPLWGSQAPGLFPPWWLVFV